MAMSKKDYVAIAGVMNKWYNDAPDSISKLAIKLMAGDLAEVFAADNPRFDFDRFDEAVCAWKEQ
jgi:hypothetical protein